MIKTIKVISEVILHFILLAPIYLPVILVIVPISFIFGNRWLEIKALILGIWYLDFIE